MPILKCQICDSEFEVSPSRADSAKYCSPACYQVSKRVERVPEEELREVYLERGLSQRATAEHFGVSPSTIQRWREHYGITGHTRKGREPTEAPPEAGLRELYLAKDLGTRAIGERFGVSHNMVRRWLKEYSIPINKSNFSLRQRGKRRPPDDVLRILYYEFRLTMSAIADLYGVTDGAVFNWMENRGFATRSLGFGHDRDAIADDGTIVKSFYEAETVNHLNDMGVKFTYEPALPFKGRHRADFHITATGWYVEVWGLSGQPKYDRRRKRKERKYRQYGVPLVGLEKHDFRRPYKYRDKLKRVVEPVQKQLKFL